MSQLYFEFLNKNQKEIFESLTIFRKEAALAGGTALCLQIGHRYSFDFDLFFERELKRKDILKLKKVIQIKEITFNTKEQINIITNNDIRITLLFYPFKAVFKKVETPFLPLFSVKDIALDKSYTIGQRAVWRDYVDLFFLLKKGYITISKILKLAPEKFNFEFSERLFLEQLVYFKDLEIIKISFAHESVSSNEIKNFFITEVKNRMQS